MCAAKTMLTVWEKARLPHRSGEPERSEFIDSRGRRKAHHTTVKQEEDLLCFSRMKVLTLQGDSQ